MGSMAPTLIIGLSALPAALALRGKWYALRRNLGLVGIFGLLAVAGAQVGFFNAVRYLPIGIALLLEYLGIILVVVWMWAVHGHRPRRLTVAGSVAAMLGLGLVLALAVPGVLAQSPSERKERIDRKISGLRDDIEAAKRKEGVLTSEIRAASQRYAAQVSSIAAGYGCRGASR